MAKILPVLRFLRPFATKFQAILRQVLLQPLRPSFYQINARCRGLSWEKGNSFGNLFGRSFFLATPIGGHFLA